MKKAILTQGLPGAGKSYILNRDYNLEGFTVIDPDEIKKEKKDYDDNNPSVYHNWSKKEAKLRIAKAIYNEENIVIDGTGTNVEKMYGYITNLQAEGYTVEIVYVKVKLTTALERNQARARTVPEHIIYEKFEDINHAFAILAGVADIATVINND